MTDLFIGVVSHRASRFSDSQGPEGLGESLGRSLRQFGFEVQVRVNLDNLYVQDSLTLDAAAVQRSLDAQLRLQRRWEAFLSPSGMGLRTRAASWLRWFRRQLARVSPPAPDSLVRLINIELSHLDLLEAGIASNAPWVLILEDDAGSSDIDDCAAGIATFLRAPEGVRPALVNLSQSFTADELGIAHLLSAVNGWSWEGRVPRALLASELPTTNTVCAILYRSSFAGELLGALRDLPVDPIVPIDWRLDEALMGLHDGGRLAPSCTYYVEPAPIVQRSMHPLRER